MASRYRTFLVSMSLFWLVFGLATTFYPQMMQLFMSAEGIAASTQFADHVWLHDGLDIVSVCVLLFALSRLTATQTTLRLAAIVGLLPTAGIVYSLLTTPYWRPIFLVPGMGCFVFAVWGFALSRGAATTAQAER